MPAPPLCVRGDTIYADLRRWGGTRHHCLHLPAGASDLVVGVALGEALAVLRLASTIRQPTLPGLGEPANTAGVPLASVIAQYTTLRSYAGNSRAGAAWVHRICRAIAADLGTLPIAAFGNTVDGQTIVCTWQQKLWDRGLSGHTCKGYLSVLFAVLTWARGKGLLAAIPDNPGGCRPGEVAYTPIWEHWTEGDFRILRERWAEDALRRGRWRQHLGPDRATWIDCVARRSLYLSLGYYTGMHTADLDRVPSDWLSWEVGRYRRENSKSARCVRPAVFDMPEQLQRDCAAEVERLGRPWYQGELVAGGPWPGSTEVLARACRRIWPENRPPLWTFRLARRSTAWEYCIRGWSAEQIAEILGHVDRTMVDEVYRRCDELGIISDRRLPWTIGSAPRGEPRTARAKLLPFAR